MNLVNPYTIGFGWAIVHSVWQIALAGIAIKFLFFLFPKENPNLRLNITLAGIFFILITFAVTFFTQVEIEKRRSEAAEITVLDEMKMRATEPEKESLQQLANIRSSSFIFSPLQGWINKWIPAISLVWALGFLFYTLRFGGSYWYLQRLRKRYAHPLGKSWQDVASKVRKDLNISRPVQLLESASVHIPMVIGHLKPVIILPLGLVTQIPFNQLEAILYHEMAHIRRNDFLVNILVILMKSMFFYHPVFWWMVKTIDLEREHCCDDTTIAHCGESKSLRQALLSLSLQNQKSHPIAAALFKNENQLLNRIKRMKTTNQKNQSRRIYPVTGLLLGAALLTLVAGSSFVPRQNDQIHGLLELPARDAVLNEARQPAHSLEADLLDPATVLPPDPDTVQKTVNASPRITNQANGITKIELDESGQLVRATRDGKELTGDELEKYKVYSDMIAEQKYKEEALQESQQELAELEQMLQQAEEKMQVVHKEYQQVMQEYMNLKMKTGSAEFPEAEHLMKDQWLAQKELAETLARRAELANFYGFHSNAGLAEEELMKIEDQRALFNDQLERSEKYMEEFIQQQEYLFEEERAFALDRKRALENESLFETGYTQFDFAVRKELQKDKLWQPGHKISFELSKKRLVVNGVKQEEKLHHKYLEIYNSCYDEPLTGNQKAVIMD